MVKELPSTGSLRGALLRKDASQSPSRRRQKSFNRERSDTYRVCSLRTLSGSLFSAVNIQMVPVVAPFGMSKMVSQRFLMC